MNSLTCQTFGSCCFSSVLSRRMSSPSRLKHLPNQLRHYTPSSCSWIRSKGFQQRVGGNSGLCGGQHGRRHANGNPSARRSDEWFKEINYSQNQRKRVRWQWEQSLRKNDDGSITLSNQALNEFAEKVVPNAMQDYVRTGADNEAYLAEVTPALNALQKGSDR